MIVPPGERCDAASPRPSMAAVPEQWHRAMMPAPVFFRCSIVRSILALSASERCVPPMTAWIFLPVRSWMQSSMFMMPGCAHPDMTAMPRGVSMDKAISSEKPSATMPPDVSLTNLDGISRTLSARYYKDGSEILIPQGEGKNPRRLSPRECARLMGYSDQYIINAVSEVQAYHQCGNSVIVPLITAVAGNLVKSMLNDECK